MHGVEQDVLSGWRKNSVDGVQKSHSWLDINNFGMNMYDSVSRLLETNSVSRRGATEGGALKQFAHAMVDITNKAPWPTRRVYDATWLDDGR